MDNERVVFGEKNGNLLEPSATKNAFLAETGGIGLGDGVVIYGLVSRPELNAQSGVVVKHRGDRVIVALDEGDAVTVAVKPKNLETAEEATPLDLSSLLNDAQRMAEAHPDTFEAPSAEALALLPRVDDVVKVCDARERFWVLVRAVDEDRVTALVINSLLSGQPYARPGSRVSFEKRCIYRMQVFVPVPSSEAVKNARYLGAHEACKAHFRDQIEGDSLDVTMGVPVESVALVEDWFRSNPGQLEGTDLAADDIGIYHIHPPSACGNHPTFYNNLANLSIATRVDSLALDD